MAHIGYGVVFQWFCCFARIAIVVVECVPAIIGTRWKQAINRLRRRKINITRCAKRREPSSAHPFFLVLRAYWTARHEWKTSANIFLLQIFIPVEMKRYWCSECKSIWIYQMGRVWFIDVPFVVCAVRPPLVANGECSFSAAIIGIVQYGMWTTPLPVRSAYTLKGIQVMQCVPVWPIFARNPFPLKSPLNDRKVRVGPQFWDNNNNNK